MELANFADETREPQTHHFRHYRVSKGILTAVSLAFVAVLRILLGGHARMLVSYEGQALSLQPV